MKPIYFLIMATVVLLIQTEFCLAEQKENKSDKDMILELLLSYENEPQKKDLLEVSQNAKQILIDIYNDQTFPLVVRARAVLAVSFFPDNEVLAFLKNVVSIPNQNEMILRKGLYSLGRGFGKMVVKDVGNFLNHENPDVRETAARVLGMIGTDEAMDLLNKRLKLERNSQVKEIIKKQIRGRVKKGVKK